MKNFSSTFVIVSLLLLIVLGVAVLGVGMAHAQTLPVGCTSSNGFSGTTGMPCNGATNIMPGCSGLQGFSTTTGAPCNGSTAATNETGITGTVGFIFGCSSSSGYSMSSGLSCTTSSNIYALNSDGTSTGYLNGCFSASGYSSTTGLPCSLINLIGTNQNPPVYVPPTTTPGLPTTGAGDSAPGNIALLIASGLIAILGAVYISRRIA